MSRPKFLQNSSQRDEIFVEMSFQIKKRAVGTLSAAYR